jgi:hypothetical protein
LCRLWQALRSSTLSRGGDSFTTSAANASRTEGADVTRICRQEQKRLKVWVKTAGARLVGLVLAVLW